jgi:hypothetical protein
MRKHAVFSPDGPARMLTHGGSVADVRGARILRTDYGIIIVGSGGEMSGALDMGEYLNAKWTATRHAFGGSQASEVGSD